MNFPMLNHIKKNFVQKRKNNYIWDRPPLTLRDIKNSMLADPQTYSISTPSISITSKLAFYNKHRDPRISYIRYNSIYMSISFRVYKQGEQNFYTL